MKMITRLIAVISCITLVAGIFVGCGKEETQRAQTDGKSFTYWTVMDSMSAKSLNNYSEMMFYQELEKVTGVHIEFIHPIQGSTGNEAFIAMLTSGTMPDMVEYTWGSYTGGAHQALDDEVIIALDDYLEEYAPNYYDYMEGEKGKKANYAYKHEATTEDGRYYGFNVLNVGEAKGFTGFYLRADLLEKWNMQVPETIDDWTAVFAKAKSEGFKKPFTCTNKVLSFVSTAVQGFNTAYNVGKGLYLQDGRIVFGPFQKGYREYVAQIAEWVKAGYIDTQYITNDNAKIESNMTNGTSMATWGYAGNGIGKILPAAQAVDPTYDLVACPYPVAKKGDISEFQQMTGAATNLAIGITTDCGNYEKAIEWCDYIYSEDGMELQLFGIEGDTYTVEEIDGEKHYTYTEKITDFEAQGLNSVGDVMYKYMLPCNHPGYNQHRDYLNGYYQMERQREALEIWNISAEKAAEHQVPNLAFTPDESAEIEDIKEIAETALEVALNDIILGNKSIDTYDAAIEQARANGYERRIEIMQAGYDRFKSKFDNK